MKVDFTSFGLAILLKIKEKLWSISPKRESNAGVHKPSLNPSGDPELGTAGLRWLLGTCLLDSAESLELHRANFWSMAPVK